jgi:transcriptional regulator of acetoin/glycerol metabolism
MQSNAELTREAWRTYASTGRLRHDLLRPEIYRAWRRSHMGHVSPRMMRPKMLAQDECARLLDHEAPLLEASAPYLTALSTAAGASRHAVLLSTSAGVLLDRRGDPITLHGPDALPLAGAMMAEMHAGSNGLGTPLAENSYVELFGPEHFISGFHDHACHGIPLRGLDGNVVGALCLSVHVPHTGRNLKEMLLTAAHGIECELRARALRGHLAELRKDPSAVSQSLALIHQDVVQSHAAARLQFEMGALQFRHGQPEQLVQGARESLARFLRNARTWQLASGVQLDEPMPLHRLVSNVVELMQTEAKVLRVQLRGGSLEDAGAQPVSAHFARLVLMETGHALRTVGPKGVVELSVVANVEGRGTGCTRSSSARMNGTLYLRSSAADGSLRIDRRLTFPGEA